MNNLLGVLNPALAYYVIDGGFILAAIAFAWHRRFVAAAYLTAYAAISAAMVWLWQYLSAQLQIATDSTLVAMANLTNNTFVFDQATDKKLSDAFFQSFYAYEDALAAIEQYHTACIIVGVCLLTIATGLILRSNRWEAGAGLICAGLANYLTDLGIASALRHGSSFPPIFHAVMLVIAIAMVALSIMRMFWRPAPHTVFQPNGGPAY